MSKGFYFGLRRDLKGYSRGREHSLTIACFLDGSGAAWEAKEEQLRDMF